MATKSTYRVPGLIIASVLAACGDPPPDVALPANAASAASAALAGASSPPNRASMSMESAPMGLAGASDADASLVELRQQVALLRREVADLRGKVSRLPGMDDVASRQPDLRTDPAALEEAQQAERMRIASTEAAFRNEQSDARWSQGTTASVQAALAQADESMRSQVRSVECRSQSCRVEINAGAGAGPAQDLPLVIARLGQVLPHVTAGQVDQGDGRKATVLYMSR